MAELTGKHFLMTAGAVAVGVAIYTLVITLVPSLNPATIATKFTTPGS